MKILNKVKEWWYGKSLLEYQMLILQQQAVIEGLQASIAITHMDYKKLLEDIQSLLRPLVMQFGGRLVIKKEFMESAPQNITITTERDKDDNLVITFKEISN